MLVLSLAKADYVSNNNARE